MRWCQNGDTSNSTNKPRLTARAPLRQKTCGKDKILQKRRSPQSACRVLSSRVSSLLVLCPSSRARVTPAHPRAPPRGGVETGVLGLGGGCLREALSDRGRSPDLNDHWLKMQSMCAGRRRQPAGVSETWRSGFYSAAQGTKQRCDYI